MQKFIGKSLLQKPHVNVNGDNLQGLIASELEWSRIHELWDTLARLPVSPLERPIRTLFQELGGLVHSPRCILLTAVKQPDWPNDDPLLGWRPKTFTLVESFDSPTTSTLVHTERVSQVDCDESTRNHVRNAGQFRATLLVDHVSSNYFESAFYKTHYRARGIVDRMFVVMPVDHEIESYFIFDRLRGAPDFSRRDLRIATYALRSLSWLNRSVHLCLGHVHANEILTPKEREVLGHLLAGNSDKQIARLAGQAPNTTHHHIMSLFRKFGVTSRTQLMSLWMNH